MEIVGWIVWIVLAYLAVTWAWGIRKYTKERGGVTNQTLVQTSLWWILAIVFLFADFNKLHILWIAPLLYVATYLLLAIPIIGQVVLLVAQVFGQVFILGLNPQEIQKARDRFLEHIETKIKEGK